MTIETRSNHPAPSELQLEKFLLEELSPDEAGSVSLALSQSAELRAKLEQMKASNLAILRKYPADFVGKRVRSRILDRRPRRFARAFWFLAPLPLAAMLLVTVMPTRRHDDGPLSEERTKGIRTSLRVYRKSGESLEKLAHGESVRPHDLVQISYTAETRQFGVILSFDGGGQVTLHWPEEPGPAPLLEPGREVALPNAFELDASPAFETFILITSDQPFDTALVLTSVKSGRASLPAELRQTSLTLRKHP